MGGKNGRRGSKNQTEVKGPRRPRALLADDEDIAIDAPAVLLPAQVEVAHGIALIKARNTAVVAEPPNRREGASRELPLPPRELGVVHGDDEAAAEDTVEVFQVLLEVLQCDARLLDIALMKKLIDLILHYIDHHPFSLSSVALHKGRHSPVIKRRTPHHCGTRHRFTKRATLPGPSRLWFWLFYIFVIPAKAGIQNNVLDPRSSRG